MNKITAALPALLVALPMLALAEGSLPASMSLSEVKSEHAEQMCMIKNSLAAGSYGDEVMCLQSRLIEDGHLKLQAPTGYFGDLTRAAVVKWQKEHGVASTGFFGALSRGKFVQPTEVVADHSKMSTMSAHPPLDVGQWPLVPSVSIQLHPDAISGWNLEATTTNFRLAPEHVNTAVLPNEGHMHVYVDGKKISRVYGNWYHLPKELFVGAGPHTVLVTLNANDHSDLSLKGARLEAKSEVITNQTQ